jgi:hypothetical protein
MKGQRSQSLGGGLSSAYRLNEEEKNNLLNKKN